MKATVLAFALLAALPAGAAFAHEHSVVHLGQTFDCGAPVRWAPRHDAAEARIAITTEDGKITLLLTDGAMAFQFSDRTMRKIDRELKRARHEHEDDDNPLGEAIRTAVIGTVRSFLDHSAECPVREIRDARCEDGRLVIVSREGERLFENVEVDDEDVLAAFDPQDAAAFADEFRRLKAGAR